MRTRVLPVVLALMAIAVMPMPAAAQMTISDYSKILSTVGGKRQEAKDAIGHLRVFHDGMDGALAVANEAFKQAGGKPSFCLSAGAENNLIPLSKVAEQVLDRTWSRQEGVPVGRVAVSILTADHPCK